MNDDRNRRGLPVTIALGAAVTLAWVAPLVLLGLFVPQKKGRYDELGLQLPTLMQVVTDTAAFAFDYGWLVVPAVVVWMILIGGVGTYLVRHRVRSAAVRTIWWLMAFVPPVLVAVTPMLAPLTACSTSVFRVASLV